MSLKATITEHMKDAMRAKDAARLGTIRMLLAEIKRHEIDKLKGGEINDTDVVAIIDKMIKQRKDSATQYEAAHRPDLADIEKAEIDVLNVYMPQPLSETEIDALIRQAIDESGATGAAAMGKVMALLKPKLAGRADLTVVSAKVKALLAG
ncbi:MAG: GatB/YqeY domain-containing protein [Proteobacteria bacterium]|nr:GatB/YqeY domain-containing protein [Pseudomonadota bacterium]MCL2307260.1 GatB/YqeY domain-containing protein [Pseudomonadota bacterium]